MIGRILPPQKYGNAMRYNFYFLTYNCFPTPGEKS